MKNYHTLNLISGQKKGKKPKSISKNKTPTSQLNMYLQLIRYRRRLLRRRRRRRRRYHESV